MPRSDRDASFGSVELVIVMVVRGEILGGNLGEKGTQRVKIEYTGEARAENIEVAVTRTG